MGNPDQYIPAAELVQDDKLVEEALGRAVDDALRRHKQAGNPVPEWRDGKLHWVAPEEVPGFSAPTDED